MTRALEGDLDEILDVARDDLAALRGARVLLTGASGFVGTWLLETLTWANQRLHLDMGVVALCRAPDRLALHLRSDPSVEPFAADVRTLEADEVPGRLDAVIHAATPANAALNTSRPLEMVDTIIAGTRRVLDLAAVSAAGSSIPFLFTSSGAVYGAVPSGADAVAEDYRGAPDPLDPRSAYHEGKRLAELLCAIATQQPNGPDAGSGPPTGVLAKVARLFAFVGPHLPIDAHFAVGNFVRDRVRGSPIIVQGDGTSVRSYLYASDMVVWLLAILNRGEAGRAYNVGSERAVDIATLANAVSKSGPGDPSIVEVRGPAMLGSAIDRYVPSTERIRRELAVSERVSLEDALDRTLKWHRSNGG